MLLGRDEERKARKLADENQITTAEHSDIYMRHVLHTGEHMFLSESPHAQLTGEAMNFLRFHRGSRTAGRRSVRSCEEKDV